MFRLWLFSDCTCFFCGNSKLLYYSYSLSENDLGEGSIHALSEGLPCFEHLRKIEWVPGPWRLLGQSMAGFVCSIARAGVQQTVLMLVPYSPLFLAPAHCALCFFSPCCFSLKLCGVTDDASKSLSHGFRQCPSMEEIMWVWEWMGRPFNIQVTLGLMSAPVFNCSVLLILLNTYWYVPLSNS